VRDAARCRFRSVLTPFCARQWYKANDTRVTRVALADVLNATAYQLVYMRQALCNVPHDEEAPCMRGANGA
jgi:hypothetical protein